MLAASLLLWCCCCCSESEKWPAKEEKIARKDGRKQRSQLRHLLYGRAAGQSPMRDGGGIGFSVCVCRHLPADIAPDQGARRPVSHSLSLTHSHSWLHLSPDDPAQ